MTNQKNPNVFQESEIDWSKFEEVNRPPKVTGPAGGPPAPTGADPHQVGVLPNSLGLPSDIPGTQLKGGPVFRLIPPAPSGQAQNNSSNTSSLLRDPSFVENQQQTAANADALAAQAQTGWQGSWIDSVVYALGAIVEDSSDIVYVSLQNQNLDNTPSSSPAFWRPTGQVQFFGAWSSVVTYGVGALVDYLGQIYISILAPNLNQIPSSSPTYWSATGSASFAGTWSSVTAYTTGQTVLGSNGSLYVALQNSTNENPVSTTGFWQLLSGSVVVFGNWNSSTAYPIGAEVFYQNSVWIATTANTNQVPSAGSSFWELVSNLATAVGFQMVSNPDFQNGLTNYNVYDNNFTGNVTLSLVADTAAPGGFGQKLQIHVAAGGESPGLGGFYYATTLDSGVVILDHYHVGDTYIVSLWANIPVGYTIGFFNNSLGTGGGVSPLSASYAGTGGWANYVWEVTIGSSPFNPNAFPFFALTGSFSSAFNWYAAQLSITDINQPARGNQNIFLGAYNSGTQYVPGNEVSNGGFYWTCQTATIGNAPPTPPATNAFWLNVGPANIDPSTAYVLAKGSTPLTLNTGLSYTSTTTSIDLIWESLALYRADGTITTIGSSSQNVTGLGSGRTFYAFPYYNESTATFGFVNNSNLSFPTLKGIAYTNAGNEYATTTTSAALPAAFSISFWVQVVSGYAGGGGLNINTSHTTLPLSSVNSVLSASWSSGTIQVGYRDSGGTFHTLASTQTYNDGEFHHVCYTCNPSAAQQFLYVDGVQVASSAVATAVSATSGFFWLNRDSGNITMTGTLTEIAFFNVALTAANADAIYNAGNSISQTALETVISSLAPTIWYKSTDAGPTTIADSGSIGGNTGTAVNSPTFGTTSAVFGAIGSPAIMWPSRSLLVTQFQNGQGNVAFTVGGWSVATTSGGSGGGSNSGSSGGSGTGCFSGNTLVLPPEGPPIRIDEIKPGDLVLGYGLVSRKVLAVHRHKAEPRHMFNLGFNEFVTGAHIVYHDRKWQAAGEVFKDNPAGLYHGEVFNLTVESSDYDGHSFLLANGLLAHNGKVT